MKPRTKGVLAFILISFGLAWAGILVAHLGLGMSMDNPLAQLPLAFSPAIAALVVRCWVTREGFRDAGLAPRVKSAWFYYLIAWIGPVLVLAASVALAAILGLYTFDLAPLREFGAGAGLPTPVALLLWLAVPILLMPVFWGEEFGWRSYLQPRVSRRPVRAALITGVIWAVWHYPLAFADYTEYSNPFLGIATWTLHTVPLAVILAWLFLRTGSVWAPSLAHAGNNMVIGMFSQVLLIDGGKLDPAIVDLLDVAPLVAVCAWILLSGQLTRGQVTPRRPVDPPAPRPRRRTLPSGHLAVVAALAAVVAAGATAAGTPTPASATTTGGYDRADLQRDLDAIRDAGTTGVQARVVEEDGDHLVATSGVADLKTREPVPADGHYRIGSNTKTFTATVVLQLAGEGKLALDDTVEQHLPGVVRGNGNDGRRITIRQLLNHTSGLPDYDEALIGEVENIDQLTIEDLRRAFGRAHTVEELLKFALAEKPTFAPGTGWSYANTGYLLAGMVIEKVTGNPWHQEVERRIIKPLDLRHTLWPGGSPRLPEPHARGYHQLRPGEPFHDVTEVHDAHADGGLISTTEDLDRFFRALLGGDLLEPGLLAEMQATVPTDSNARYGLGLEWNPVSCGGYWSHGGNTLGSVSREGFTPDGRSVVLAATTSSFHLPTADRQEAAIADLIDGALCDTG